MKKGEVRDLAVNSPRKEKGKAKEADNAVPSPTPGPKPASGPKPALPKGKTPSRNLDNVQPYEARKVRIEKDVEMRDIVENEDSIQKPPSRGEPKEEGGKRAARQSEPSAT
ncbi:hypothetical protein C8F04DRAFT_1183353 [Mycena alexandri]|uniref:Uncharacterized protein n=1 Tax=Mycena alexandri TaxID=1745969 RepID=A0AAD6SWE8_9AGAR|nr:hypothetical protein C8F04DRAFT_1183353 [Mycena alexandri]